MFRGRGQRFGRTYVGDGPNTGFESPVSDTKLSDLCLPSPSSGERAQGAPLSLLFSGKEKHININKFAGLSRDWVGAKILFICFF